LDLRLHFVRSRKVWEIDLSCSRAVVQRLPRGLTEDESLCTSPSGHGRTIRLTCCLFPISQKIGTIKFSVNLDSTDYE
jgi:hypothetical protein